ncbi:MAG: amidohydrolase family protein [Pirellulaceae bacterium]|jgi:hypothetical protein|nr:amidohydrolase family protein [Pirellulaceae bacterium]
MIIDAHGHLGRSPQFDFPDVSVTTMLDMMFRLGIDRIICCHLGMLQGDWQQGFRESLQAVGESGGRILCYAGFDPALSDALDCVRRCLDCEGFVGVKIHPSMHGRYADDPCYDPVWQLAAERDVPILSHSWDISEQNPSQKYSFPRRFAEYCGRYPEVKLILGHAGGRFGGHVAAAELARQFEHVHLDLAGDCYTWGLIEYLVEQVGASRVLFGSDMTWIDPRTQLGMILDADVSSDAKAMILGGNATRLFGLEKSELNHES